MGRDKGDEPAPGYCEPCGKIRYASRQHARQAVRKMAGLRSRMRAYRCPEDPEESAFWHLTSRPERVVTYWRDYERG